MKFNEFINKITETTLLEKTNDDVIKMFINNSFPKDKLPNWGTENLTINKEPNGWSLINYSTPILYRKNKDGSLYFNIDKYSVSTSKIQNSIRAGLSYMPSKNIKTVHEEEIREIMGK